MRAVAAILIGAMLTLPMCALETVSRSDFAETSALPSEYGETSASEMPDSPELYSSADFNADGITDALPDDIRELLPDNGERLFEPDAALEDLDVGFFAGLASKLFTLALGPALESFTGLLGLLIIMSALGSIRGSIASPPLSGVFSLVGRLCILLSVYPTVLGLFTRGQEYLERLGALMSAMIPVMTGVAVAGGNLSASVVQSSAMLLALKAIELLASVGLMPVLRLTLGLSAASGVGGGVRLGAITRLVRSLFTTLLSVTAAAVSALMSFQTALASSADSLSMRAVRFAATSAIPVAGGIAAEAMRTVAGSLGLVRSTVGWVGVVLILLLTLPLLIELFLIRLGFSAAGTAAEVIGLEAESKLLGELSGLLGMLIGVMVISALMFVLALAVFAKGAVALAG